MKIMEDFQPVKDPYFILSFFSVKRSRILNRHFDYIRVLYKDPAHFVVNDKQVHTS